VSAAVSDPKGVLALEHRGRHEEGAHVVGSQSQLVGLRLKQARAVDADRFAV
jgi:hypothetical protein